MQIDLNSDLGEGFGPWNMGEDEAMLTLVTSANIACGGHASDPETMFKTLQLAKERGVTVGAHPGFNDKEGFGRRLIPMPPSEIARMIAAQVGALMAVAALVPVPVRFVKPHGALGNLAARDLAVAKSIVGAVQRISTDLSILAISGTCLEQAARDAGVPVHSEIFADRGYLSTGQLVPRGSSGAMIHDANEATDRLISFLKTGKMPVIDGDPINLVAHSICVHGDSDGAVNMAKEVRARLTLKGVKIRPFLE